MLVISFRICVRILIMEHARPPAELVLEGGPASRADLWRKWLRQFRVFLKASGVSKESSDVQASLLINLIGPEGYDIYSTLKFKAEKDNEEVEKVIDAFNEYFGTKTNVIMVRFKFFTRIQEKGESIDEYVTALKLLSQRCEFEQLEDSLVRDKIVCGVADSALRDRLLRADDLTLEKAIKICQANELSTDENRQIEGVKSEVKTLAVDGLWRTQRGAKQFTSGRARARDAGGAGGEQRVRAAASWVSRSGSRGGRSGAGGRPAGGAACAACGSARCDGSDWCVAKKANCFLCGNKGHFRVKCPVKINNVCEINKDSDEEGELYYISMIECVDSITNTNDNKWFETLYLPTCNSDVLFKLDTGSDINVLSKYNFEKLGFSLSELTHDNVRAKSFCGNYLSIIGSIVIKVVHKKNEYKLRFIISNQVGCQSILGKHALEELGLVQRIFSINLDNYADLFKGLGKLPGFYKIPLQSNANPCICPVRKIPVGVRDQLQTELNRMEALGVIRKVSHPTSWVNGIVVAAKKDGNLRVCLDPRPLNKVIRRQHYPLPTLTEIATKLKGAHYFSKLDARSGFWMVQLDDDSADLCTFGTPFGRFQYLRLPYGINSASEIFHARIRQLLEDLEGVDSFVDDVIVWGCTKDEHDSRLTGLLERSRQVGIKFNKEKCEFCVTEVTYLGHTFSAEGMKIDQSKQKAITQMPSPRDRQSLERFLGMINYVSKFIPHYSQKVAPLRNLLKKDSEWCWSENEERVVSELKAALCRAPVLALFAPREPAVLSVDASSHALGAVLLQAGRPVEFASLTLTDTQQRYAQIEKEMLAIVFALERFHQYIFGKSDIIVESDHKPLEALFKKTLDSVPARLQRMMLRVQRYDFTVVYKPGKYMYVADALSRAPLTELLHTNISEEIEDQTCFLLQNVRVSNKILHLIKEFTSKDIEGNKLIEYIKNGWPSNKYETYECVRQYWSYRECLEYADGVIFCNDLVFIPCGLRSEMLSRVHEGHLGIDRCKRRARDVMFWAGMSRDVERKVRQCRVCAESRARPQREPMIPHTIPQLPWNKIGSDIFEYSKKSYLILTDYFSNYVEVCPLLAINSRQVILAMKDQFARHGIPKELVTDNGPAYASKEFRAFAQAWGFVHTTSSPNYPQSNGRSERSVRTVKELLSKCTKSNDDFYLGLLNYRSTPRDGVASPAQLLMGRRLNTRLPSHPQKLKPARNNENDYENLLRNQNKSREQYDRRARTLPQLRAGDEVVALDGAARRRARVCAPAPQPRSYFVADQTGRIFRRNRRHLIKLPEPPSPPISFDETMRQEDYSEEDDSESDKYGSCVNTDVSTDPGNESDERTNRPLPQLSERAAAREAKEKINKIFTKK